MRRRGAWARDAPAAVLFVLLPVLASPQPGPLRLHGRAALERVLSGLSPARGGRTAGADGGRAVRQGHAPGGIRGHPLRMCLRGSTGWDGAALAFAAGQGPLRGTAGAAARLPVPRAAAAAVALGRLGGSKQHAPRASALVDVPSRECWRPTARGGRRAATAASSKREGAGDDSQSTGERKKVPLAVSTPPCGLPVWCVRARAHALTRTRAQVKSPLTGRHINVDGPAFQKVIDLGYIYIDDQLVCCRHCDLWSDLRGRASPSAKAGGC